MVRLSYIYLIFTLFNHFGYAREAQIIFSNGDSLTGDITAIKADSIDFSHSALSPSGSTQQIAISALHKIVFKKEQTPAKQLNSHVTLTNRDFQALPTDLYKGAINNISDDNIILDTNFAGKVQLKKQFIQSLKMFNPEIHLLTSLGNINEWKKSTKDLSIKQLQNSFVFSPPKSKNVYNIDYIYRPVDLPDRYYVDVQLDNFLENTSNAGTFRIYLNSDDKGNLSKAKQTFFIEVTPYNVRLSMNNALKRLQNIKSKRIDTQSIKGSSYRLRIYINIPEKKLSLFLNDKLFFSDVNIDFLDKELLGKHISLGFSRNKVDRSISNFNVTKWSNNTLPYNNDKRIALDQITPSYNKIKFHNGDFIYGEILSIDKGEALIKNQFGKFRVKLTNLTDLDLGDEDRDLIFMDVNDTRFEFYDGSSIIAKVLDITENKFKVESQVFEGKLEFDINQMTSIEFTNSLYPF